ncbi:ribosome assembly protein 1 [Kwoniella heveanensis BCC8398]|uniref:Ribosome assembly protein 1 n=1 Tax=Kwoniella heveanensis BCC8398 TaxID=1296120 RepID=A0A1B9H110_9TREE|nr:ribosome assembly protein 1 [Kwoniella heveanensis BCC8398]
MSNSFAVPLANTRNVTIVAHVDHGKTSFADSLLSSNNIISTRMAGKLRFLDSREDEQERGITMESSAVSLRFDMNRIGQDGVASTSKHLCNVIDTPGHVDFASEVSTASRLCDGALVLVDCWEGVCTQTIAVLRQAWIDRLRPLLVINKMDRLITELQMSPSEAYHHLSQLIEQVNAVMGSFYASERMEDDLRWREEREKRLAARRSAQEGDAPEEGDEVDGEYEEKEDEDIYFAPDRGNVLFASAIDGWAFRLGKFARLYGEKLKIKEGNLRRVLWGDWYLDPKTKRVVGRKKLAGRNLKPMFVQFVLENIWRVYDTVLNQHDPDATQKIVNALGVRVTPRDIRSKDTRNLLTLIMQQWLPLSTATFQAVVDVIPSPSDAQAIRLPFMLHHEKAAASNTALAPNNDLEKGLYGCDQSEGANVVAYVSKMFAVQRSELPEFKPKEMTAEEMRQRGKEERERRAALLVSRQNGDGDESVFTAGTPLPDETESIAKPLESLKLDEPAPDVPLSPVDESLEVLLGFSRIFSGVLRRNTSVIATLPKYESDLGPMHPRNAKHVMKVQVGDLYMMMGRELVSVEEVPAGHVCAIGGLERAVPRSATLWASNAQGVQEVSDDAELINLAGVSMQAAPIVRVALEPENPSDMPKLIRGLQILNQADPCAEYLVQETGEHVIITAGELHLERCLKDLRERFARCAIQQSDVIVPFRETAVKAPDMAPPKTAGAPRGTIHGTVLNGLVSFTVRALPLPPKIIEFLLAHTSSIGGMLVQKRDQTNEEEENQEERDAGEGTGQAQRYLTPEQFWAELEQLCEKAGPDWAGAADRIWSFGPKRMGANVLLDPVGKSQLRLRGKEKVFASARAEGKSADDALQSADAAIAQDQLASLTTTNDEGDDDIDSARAELRMLRDFENSIEAGFQMATFQGPLCSEPVVGMAWVVEDVKLNKEEFESEQGKGRSSAVAGALISSVRDACRAGLLDWSPRIKLAMYTCDIQASTDVLGKVYGVVARRRGRIVSEEMKEGTSFFTIRAMLPIVESFGFADEIRKRTSGAASPQLIFSGFETLDQDPFWVPTTVEELEDLGEKADRANIAKGYVDGVRKRKGMFVERKIVEFAEKQRTLKK